MTETHVAALAASIAANPRVGYVLNAVNGHPPAKQKQLIVRAAGDDIGLLQQDEADMIIAGLDLTGA